MKNLYLLLIVSILFSCAPQKYGRYFSHRPYDTQTEQISNESGEQPELIASTIEMSTIDLKIDSTADQKDDGHMDRNQFEEYRDSMALKQYGTDSMKVVSQTDSTLVAKSSILIEKKIEPLGVAGIISLLIALSIMLIMWNAAAVIPVVVFFGIATILGLVSGYRIKLRPDKWKGKGFSVFLKTVFLTFFVISGLFILLLVSTVD